MKAFRPVGITVAILVLLAGLLAWGVPSAQAAPTSNSQDPAQHSTAVVLFVKVNTGPGGNGTDTLLVVNRQQRPGDDTTTGPAIQLKGNFYDRFCTKGSDINIFLTPQDVEVPGLVGTAFGVTQSGVVLLNLFDNTLTGPVLFTASGIVIDLGFLAVYERQGSPLLQPPAGGGAGVCPQLGGARWGGFSVAEQCALIGFPFQLANSLDDWFIQTGPFRTMIQMICPGLSQLATDMNTLASPGGGTIQPTGFANGFDPVNTYNASEVLIRSRHNVRCFCNSDSQLFGDFADVLTDMAAVGLGTFHWRPRLQFVTHGAVIAWRTIAVGPGFTGITWDGRMRTVPGVTD